jgi:hypothetical protein
MANFLISPGVITNEIDQSQYAATTPGTGNVAALIGYAEKGPFDPTIVTSQQDFNLTFGKTLAQVPYLAQAAYKYFNQGSQLLVVRAGDNRDPTAYPSAAQYASKRIRIQPSTVATVGKQSFKATDGVAAGSFAPNSTYGFNLLADFRAFKAPKIVESWTGLAVEIANNIGAPAPATTIDAPLFKIAVGANADTAFTANFKRNQDAVNGTSEYYGASGTRNGSVLGSAALVTLRQYRDGDTYANVDTDLMTIAGTYGAAVLASSEFAGHDWSANQAGFVLDGDTITLNANCATVVAAISHITAQIADSNYVVFEMKKASGHSKICIRRTAGTGTTLTLGAPTTGGNALPTLGWTVGTYNDSDWIYGTWHAEYPHAIAPSTANPSTFDGIFLFNKTATTPNVKSFQDVGTVVITSPTSGIWTLASMKIAIQAAIDNLYSIYHFPKSRAIVDSGAGKITIDSAGPASSTFTSMVNISAPSSGNSLVSLLGGTEAAEDGIPPGGIGEGIVNLRAKEKGSYGNNLIFRTETKVINVGQTQITNENVYVLWNGQQVSAYTKVNWIDPSATNYINTVMANDGYIVLDAEDEDGNSTMVKLPNGDWVLGTVDIPNGVDSASVLIADFSVGTNGWVEDSNNVITTMSADYANALTKIANPEVYEYNLVSAPGGADPIVQNAVAALVESRHDVFGVVDAAPFGLGLGIASRNSDITMVNDACSTLTSSYVGAFWPWLYDYDSDNKQYVWLPPSIYALEAMVYTDNIADPWYAPAGTTRGKVAAINIEYSPDRTERDILYGGTAIVNSLVKFVNEGIVIWGQKTTQRTDTATNRINVRRLLIYAEKLIAKMARGFLFEPDDSTNWAAFARQANAILEPIRQRRGLTQYTVVCDSSTNTASTINQNLMVGKIFLQPTKTTEFVEVDFTINAATGETTVSG